MTTKNCMTCFWPINSLDMQCGACREKEVERAIVRRIAKWLRTPQPGTICDDQKRDNAIADAIEKGEWKSEGGRSPADLLTERPKEARGKK